MQSKVEQFSIPIKEAIDRAKPHHPATSYISHKGFNIAQNYKVFSSEVARAAYKQKHGTDATPARPQFLLRAPISIHKPVAILVGHPVTKFLAACLEDGIAPGTALEQIKNGTSPTIHFLPQSRYLYDHNQTVICWKAPDHICEFWETMGFGEPPVLRPSAPNTPEVSESEKAKILEAYAEDVLLFNSINKAGTVCALSRKQPPALAKMMETFARSGALFLRKGAPLASAELLAEREDICRSCPEWSSTGFGGSGRCLKCGCSTWAKLRMQTEKCPIGKW